MLCPSGMYLTVVLVLVLAVTLVSAGAYTYDCLRWGYFQQFETNRDQSVGCNDLLISQLRSFFTEDHDIANKL